MKDFDPYILVSLVFIILIVILAIYLFSAKAERRKITLTNEKGTQVAVDAEVADSSATQMKGLMGKSSLGEDEGMLFVFNHDDMHSFWMLNTTIPLEAIHFASNGTVVDIISMQPCGFNVTSCKIYTPKAPSRFVLEVNAGFAEKNGISIGNSSFDPGQLS